jgi:hypothetical protein
MVIGKRRFLILLVVAGTFALLAAPALGLETKIAGVSLGDTPEELLSSAILGTPDGIFTPGGVFNAVKSMPGETPPWAIAVQMEQLQPDQVEWVYNRDPVTVGIVITGEGINAHVSDIIVSEWRNFEPNNIGQTTKGIRLGSSFADVLAGYGWPNRLQIISEGGSTQQTPTRQAVGAPGAAAAGARTPSVIRFGFGRSGMSAASAATTPPPALPSVGSWGVTSPAPIAPRVNPNYGAAPAGGGPGPLPAVGVASPFAPVGPGYTTTAAMGETPEVTFTKSCILSYPSVDFVVYRMRVFRIHIYGR